MLWYLRWYDMNDIVISTVIWYATWLLICLIGDLKAKKVSAAAVNYSYNIRIVMIIIWGKSTKGRYWIYHGYWKNIAWYLNYFMQTFTSTKRDQSIQRQLIIKEYIFISLEDNFLLRWTQSDARNQNDTAGTGTKI